MQKALESTENLSVDEVEEYGAQGINLLET